MAGSRRCGSDDINISRSKVFMKFKEAAYVFVSGNGDKGALVVGEEVLNEERMKVVLPHISNFRFEIIKFGVKGEAGCVGVSTGVG